MILANRNRFGDVLHKQAYEDDKILIYSQFGEYSYRDCYSNMRNLANWMVKSDLLPKHNGARQIFLIDGDGEIAHIVFILTALEMEIPFIPMNKALARSGHLTTELSRAVRVNCRGDEVSISDKSMHTSQVLNDNEILEDKIESVSGLRSHNEWLACCFPTSGTTGYPKFIAVSNYHLFKGAFFVNNSLQVNSKDILIGMLSLDFDYGLNQVLGTIVAGASYVCFQFAQITEEALSSLLEIKPTVLATMPFLVDTYFPAISNFVLKDIRIVTSSGGPLTDNHRKKILKLCPNATVIPMYGLSEGFRATISNPQIDLEHPNSVGIPIGDTEISIRDDLGSIVPDGQVGEIWQSGGCLSWGYWNDPESTKLRFVPDHEFPNKLWLKSGDLGYKNSEGALFVVGRKTFQIKKYGNRISIDEAESLISDVLDGLTVIAIPIEISTTESDFDIFIETEEEKKALIANEIASRLPREIWPRKLICVKEIPLNIYGGKPDRQILLRWSIEDDTNQNSHFSRILANNE